MITGRSVTSQESSKLWHSDYEFKYALADEVDAIIGLEINDAHFMSFNRDDDRHKGVVVRVS